MYTNWCLLKKSVCFLRCDVVFFVDLMKMLIVIFAVLLGSFPQNVFAQQQDLVATCYTSGSILGAIIGTLLITLALVGAAILLYKVYWRSRKGKHLVLVTDAENPSDEYAFDNPGFREATPIKQALQDEKPSSKNWLSGWSPLHTFSTIRNEKLRSLDDSFMSDSHLKVVSLKSYDFTGLGFTVCGNMRDGIFVKDLLHRGPAFESGRIAPGDRIDSVCISFRHMVFEDALTILSYASPYEVQVQVEHNPSRPSTLLRNKRESNIQSTGERIRHPFYRSQSIADLAQIGKNNIKRGNHSTQNSVSERTDYPTLKLPTEPKREIQKLEKKASAGEDTTDSSKNSDTTSRLHKLGIKVLPVSLNFPKSREPENTDNEKNIEREQSENDGVDVKALLTKGLQNLKEKINQNSLGRKKKEVEEPNDNNIPEEVSRAAEAAQNNRKKIEDTVSTSSTESVKVRKNKGKAPAPPVLPKEPPPPPEEKDIFEPNTVTDSDSEVEVKTRIELTSTQVTVHHSPNLEETESGRKAASLGDLSKLDAETSLSLPLERAVSLDLDASSHGKKRKAPTSPEELTAPFDIYNKEPRLEGYNTFQRRLKKSSDFGTLEDALSDPEEVPIEEVHNLHIQEFSSWLEECRKPQPDSGNSLVLVNGEIENQTVNGQNLQEPVTVLVISQPNSLEPEPAKDDDEPIPELPSSPMPTLPSTPSLTYITEIKVSTSEPTKTKPLRKDAYEPSKIPIRTMKSETGQRVLAAIQSLAQENAKRSEFFNDSPPSVAGYQLKKIPPVVPPRKAADDAWEINKDIINGSPVNFQTQSGVNLPVKTSATKIVFESKDVENEQF